MHAEPESIEGSISSKENKPVYVGFHRLDKEDRYYYLVYKDTSVLVYFRKSIIVYLFFQISSQWDSWKNRVAFISIGKFHETLRFLDQLFMVFRLRVQIQIPVLLKVFTMDQ